MAAGVTDRAFEVADIVTIFEDYERRLEEQKKAEKLQRLEQAYARFGSALGHDL